jgi:hypothetical protein
MKWHLIGCSGTFTFLIVFDLRFARWTNSDDIHHVNQRMRGLATLLTSTKDLWFPRGNHVHVTQNSPQPLGLPSCGWDCLEPLYFIKGVQGLWDNDYWGAQETLLLITFRRERERERRRRSSALHHLFIVDHLSRQHELHSEILVWTDGINKRACNLLIFVPSHPSHGLFQS